MKMFLGWSILVCLLCSVGMGQDTVAVRGEKLPWEGQQPVDAIRSVPQTAFREGERLVFDVGYAFITAGEAVMSIPKKDTAFGRECYQILFTVNSTPSFSWIYRVDDRYETIVDKEGIFPWRFSQRIREGKFSRDYDAVLDQVNHVAVTEKGSFPIPPYIQDVVSAFYFVRTMDFSSSRPGERTILYNFTKDTSYTLAVKFLGRQQIKVDAGTFRCVIVEPLIQEGGLFKSEGRVIIWLTDDERKIPVKVSTQVVIGSIDAELREYYGVAGPIRAKIQ